MCGRYTLIETDGLNTCFDADNDLKDLCPNYNVAPGQIMPVVTHNSPNKLELMKWGLVPFWAKDSQIGYKMINARAEGIQDKPSFRSALKTKRCLVPTTGFYEWKKENDIKQPYFIHLKNQEMFSFAGLYETWKDAEGNELKTYTIITTVPNSLMESIHDRMPVILAKENEAEWLDNTLTNTDQLTRLLSAYQAEEMEAFPVSTDVNIVKNQSNKLMVPLN